VGKEEYAEVLEGIINDADLAEKAAAGDFGDMTEDQLTGAERALLSAAAGELDDDVSGFASDYIKLGDPIDGSFEKIEWTYKDKPNVRAAFGFLKLDGIKEW